LQGHIVIPSVVALKTNFLDVGRQLVAHQHWIPPSPKLQPHPLCPSLVRNPVHTTQPLCEQCGQILKELSLVITNNQTEGRQGNKIQTMLDHLHGVIEKI
jgi:hypothetical protein